MELGDDGLARLNADHLSPARSRSKVVAKSGALGDHGRLDWMVAPARLTC